MQHGFKNVHPLFGGFEAWEKGGLPVEQRAQNEKEKNLAQGT
jgi:3-mercaptopyruvate sulfurtransferase SseA